MEMLRFATAGSVDDGKSTLIGRLLYDSKAIFEDQLRGGRAREPRQGRRVRQPGAAHRRPARRARAGHHHRRRVPLLRHAAAQVRHRRHPGPHPVHPQHGDRRLDRRPGRSCSSTRARAWSSRAAGTPSSSALLRVPHLVLAVNKMDLVDYDQDVYDRIHAEFTTFAAKLDITDLTVIPMSALKGDNIVTRLGAHALVRRARRCCTTWRTSTWPATATSSTRASRCSTSSGRSRDAYHDYRGYAGTVAGGVLKPGDDVVVLPERPAVADRRRSTPPTDRSRRRSRRCR